MPPGFEWDDDKAAANERKHGVTFAEACTVFEDPLAAIFSDPDHSEEEEREIIVGYSQRDRLLVVSYTSRPPNLRIISARRASPKERHKHEQNPM
jgi:hypothetical protein